MKPRSATLFPLVLLIGLALLSMWLEHAVRVRDQDTQANLRHDPDFIVEQFTTVETGKEGRPSATLSAQRMVHFPDDETSELEQPHIIHMSPERPAIHIMADRGLVTGTGERVQLFGNVVVKRVATEAHPELRMETKYLEVFPDEQIARTPEAVVLTEGASRMQAVGMEVNSGTGQIQLLSRVSGVYIAP